ncbi:hypothetical protein PM082_020168 [Marasmius tenuissimus]|nr:hypothetical protein PM082_020168 [Marasmius tenuissimus]
MQFKATLVALITGIVAVHAASTTNLERRITDQGNPANLINCPPGGGADACNLEQGCSPQRIRVNYGSTQNGHYIWYNYDIGNIPTGVQVSTEQGCTDY